MNKARRHSRFPVRWPVIYGCDEFIANGTMLDFSFMGCRLAGTMPVHPNMPITLHVFPPCTTAQLHIDEARVTWVRGEEFGIELHRLSPLAHHWILRYIERAEHRARFQYSSELPIALPFPVRRDDVMHSRPAFIGISVPVVEEEDKACLQRSSFQV